MIFIIKGTPSLRLPVSIALHDVSHIVFKRYSCVMLFSLSDVIFNYKYIGVSQVAAYIDFNLLKHKTQSVFGVHWRLNVWKLKCDERKVKDKEYMMNDQN